MSESKHTPGFDSTFQVYGDMNRYDLIVSLHTTIQERDRLRAAADELAGALTDLRAKLANCATRSGSDEWAVEILCRAADAALSNYRKGQPT